MLSTSPPDAFELPLSPELTAFRDDVRRFVADAVPPAVAERMRAGLNPTREEMLGWTASLHSRGWSTPSWPVEYGGPGWSALQRYVFDVECVAGNAPRAGAQGLEMIGPILCAYGSDAQKRDYLPPTQRGEMLWAQGFSEPGAGSDLGALKTRAERRGDRWIVNGQKIWTTEAHIADMVFCLLRTDEPDAGSREISIILIDLKSPGISIRPIITIDGAHTLNQVFFDNVEVPLQNLVGERGGGWAYSKFILEAERARSAQVPRLRRHFNRLLVLAAERGLLERSHALVQRLSWCEAEIVAVEAMTLRVLEEQDAGVAGGWPAGNLLKMRGSALMQRLMDLQLEVIGPQAQYDVVGVDGAAPAGVLNEALFQRAITIFGGTSEIQRDIVARHLLEG